MVDPKWGEIFPNRHKNDDRYTFHCVDCGKLLFRYDISWDGHRNECGDLIERHNSVRILDGLRCIKCAIIFQDTLLAAYIDFKKRQVR